VAKVEAQMGGQTIIKRIRASVHNVDLKVPLVDKPVGNRSIVFCEVETSDGTVGYGMTEYFLTHAIKAAIDHHFAPLMIGMDLTDVEKIHHKVGHVLNPRAMTGVVSCALSCIDIALWDAHGKITGRTVAALLGGFRDHAEAYVTFGFPNYDIDGLVDAAKHQMKLGAQKLKMVVAAHPGGWKEDVRRVRAVRDAIGSDIELMCDANYEFSPPDARMFAQAVEECDLSWFEEPLWQNDARALAALRSQIRIPISAGQMEGSRWRFREFVEHKALDLLQPNCAFLGGYTECQKVAHLGQTFNLPIAHGGGLASLNLHEMCGFMNGTTIEIYNGAQFSENYVWKNVPELDMKTQTVRLFDTPGIGLEPNHDFLNDSETKA
jgi:L-alanine-DL-glutamate epimerase-like enolase superfamily enzyme